jgi:hypothetical protein
VIKQTTKQENTKPEKEREREKMNEKEWMRNQPH